VLELLAGVGLSAGEDEVEFCDSADEVIDVVSASGAVDVKDVFAWCVDELRRVFSAPVVSDIVGSVVDVVASAADVDKVVDDDAPGVSDMVGSVVDVVASAADVDKVVDDDAPGEVSDVVGSAVDVVANVEASAVVVAAVANASCSAEIAQEFRESWPNRHPPKQSKCDGPVHAVHAESHGTQRPMDASK